MKVYLVIIPLLFLSVAGHAQEIEVNGRIVDYNKKPLPYATIKLKNAAIGVVSNQNGDFRLQLRQQFLRDTLVISFIGYNVEMVAVSNLKPQELNIIVLKDAATQLEAVEIQARRSGRLTAEKIVAAAIKNIEYNYPSDHFRYVAYYRDYQIKENNYTNLNEAIVRVIDDGFESNDQINTQLELMQYRVNKTFPTDTFSSKPYDNKEKKFIPQARVGSFGGNELAILRVHDALRNYENYAYSFVGTFSKDFIKNHTLQISKVVPHNNAIELYEIEFHSRLGAAGDSHFSSGKIYIEKQNYKIHKLEYSVYERSWKKDNLIYNIKVEYNEYHGKMYLNYISFNNKFMMRNPDDFEVVDTRILSDFSGFSILFNNELDTLSATNRSNYRFTINGKKIELDTIIFSSWGKGKELIAVIKNPGDYGVFADTKMAKNINAEYSNIKDNLNREVNKMTFIEATQYREIFVQKIEPQTTSNAKILPMDKFVPLSEAGVTSNMENFEDYWMNTPLKSSIDNNESF